MIKDATMFLKMSGRLDVDGETFQKVFAETLVHRIEQFEMRVPCLAHLIALKLHAIKNNPGRKSKDMQDIVDLIEANSGKVSMKESSTTRNTGTAPAAGT